MSQGKSNVDKSIVDIYYILQFTLPYEFVIGICVFRVVHFPYLILSNIILKSQLCVWGVCVGMCVLVLFVFICLFLFSEN